MVAVRVTHMEVIGWQAPHELKIEITGRIDETVVDDIVLVAHNRRHEFLAAVGPTIAEAFERVFLRPESADAAKAEPPKIEDIEL